MKALKLKFWKIIICNFWNSFAGIRTALTESDELECPGCHEKDTSPNELIPNRFLRTAVNAFKNETGYSKPSKVPEKKESSSRKEAQAAAAESRKISIEDELPDDLFPHSPRKIDHTESDQAEDAAAKGTHVHSNFQNLHLKILKIDSKFNRMFRNF